jgi:hypothetical protein
MISGPDILEQPFSIREDGNKNACNLSVTGCRYRGKIPPTLPFPKGGIPLFFASANQPGLRQRGVRGDFLIIATHN